MMKKQTELEFAGVKVKGSKMLLILPLLGSIIGALWGGFVFYKDYLDMKEQILSYTAPDLSGFDKRLEVMESELNMIMDEVTLVADVAKELKNDLRQDIRRIEKIVEDVEQRVKEDARENVKDFKELKEEVENSIQKALENPLNNMRKQ
tara:strand:+ start:5978 stop:6424 length:447 start_codon:yes stop_codon:yes gene_type:complete